MQAGHKMETMLLQEYYKRPGHPVLLISGRQGIGKTSLVKDFVSEHPHFYYQGADCSEKEQIRLLKKACAEQLFPVEAESLAGILQGLFEAVKTEDKFILVLDECDRIWKNSNSFVEEWLILLEMMKTKRNYMVVLLTSDIQSVHDAKNEKMSRVLSSVTRQIPLGEYSFTDVVACLKDCDRKQHIEIYSVFGGVIDYLRLWDQGKSFKDNIISLCLLENGLLRREAERYLHLYLRELSSYNSVLTAMAQGKIKLNDLYEYTGFSRAKVSVYLKNLIQIGVVEKLTLYGPEKKDPALKGLYVISDSFLRFYYRFVFPNLSALEEQGPHWVYDNCIEPFLDEYMQSTFVLVCRQFMQLMSRYKKLPFSIENLAPWYGTEGSIPIMATDGEGHLISCFCQWSEELFDEHVLEENLRYLLKTGFEPDYYYLFAKSGFSEGLKKKAQKVDSIKMIDLDDF